MAVYREDPFQKIVNVGWGQRGICAVSLQVTLTARNDTLIPPSEPFFSAALDIHGLSTLDLLSGPNLPFVGPAISQNVSSEMLAAYKAWSYTPYHNVETTSDHFTGHYALIPTPVGDPGVLAALNATGDYPIEPQQWATEAEAIAALNAFRAAHPEIAGIGFFVEHTPDFDESDITATRRLITFLNMGKLPSNDAGNLEFTIRTSAQPPGTGMIYSLLALTSLGRSFPATAQNQFFFLFWNPVDFFGDGRDALEGPPIPAINTKITINRRTRLITAEVS